MGWRSSAGMQCRKGVGTHNCRTPREHGIAMTSGTGTYGFSVMKHCGVYPDEVKYRGVPILRHSQVRRNRWNFLRSYSNEEREYCETAMSHRSLTERRKIYPRISSQTKHISTLRQSELDISFKRKKNDEPHLQRSECNHISIDIVWRQ